VNEGNGGWTVRSITAAELPAICAYCRVRCPEQAVAVITYTARAEGNSPAQHVRASRSAPVCVDHAVYVQQTYILEQKPERIGA